MPEIFDSVQFARRGLGNSKVVRLAIVLFILLLLVVFSPVGTIRAGERGVRLRFDAVTGATVNPGLYFRIPVIEQVQTMDVKTQKEEMEAAAASKDLQTVSIRVALNYNLDPSQVARIYQEVGRDYKSRIIDPAMQEGVKSSTAKFTAEELITKREAVREDTKAQLKERLQVSGIIVTEFNITNFNFSKVFNDAIEAKVTAEQQALAAKNKLEQIKFEAEQRIVEARGKAEAMTVESNALRSNPMILELRALEKWNGILPQVTGGATPFISLPASITQQAGRGGR